MTNTTTFTNANNNKFYYAIKNSVENYGAVSFSNIKKNFRGCHASSICYDMENVMRTVNCGHFEIKYYEKLDNGNTLFHYVVKAN